jgi:hypothetical protein
VTANIANQIGGFVPKLGASIDTFFVAAWWWRYRRHRAERRLTRTLERYGEQSMAARRATERFRDLEFAVTFWRPARRPVQQVVRDAVASGVPIDALRFAVTSHAFGMDGACVVLRCSYALAIVSAALSLIVLGESVVAFVISFFVPGRIVMKSGLLLAVAGLDLMMWRAWMLWWIQPRKAIKQWRAMLERSCGRLRQVTPARLHASKP